MQLRIYDSAKKTRPKKIKKKKEKLLKIRIHIRNGRFSIAKEFVSDPSKRVVFSQNPQDPEDWFVGLHDKIGFPVREIPTETLYYVFPCMTLVRQMKKIFKFRYSTAWFEITREPEVTSEGIAWHRLERSSRQA